ncbi:Pre-rRNA-processing protein ipi3 [Malassezia cuniculi]|uniref:Pre-rRNA-processing protein IPI3 n=1 Tax=Malassezia cuniculi TaxID=948313 RepID=A0AAF0EX28_9BASI|nr:Pre-rRNA-processing protein ipi3 [Malassezia cuniculi]
MADRVGSVGALFAPEVVLAASASGAQQRGALLVLDPAAASAAPLVHLKGATHAAPHGVSCTPSATHAAGDSGTGGLVAVIENERALLIVYSWQKDQPLARIVLPQKMVAAELSPDGTYIATGAADGRLFIWEVASGALITSFEGHYRAITALRWTSDSAALVSASADSRVCVWSLSSVFGASDLGADAHVPSPYAFFADHTLQVTDVLVTPGAFPNAAKVWSASKDMSVKLWDLARRQLVSTFSFPAAIGCIALDPLERFLVAGEAAQKGPGRLFRVDLYDAETVRARGGRGTEGEIVRTDGMPTLVLDDAITAVAVSNAGSHAVVGTAAGQLHVADVSTLQVQRVLSACGAPTRTPDTPVTNIRMLMRPADLMSGMQLWAAAGTKRSAATRDALAASSTHITPLPPPYVSPQFQRAVVQGGGEMSRVLVRIGDGKAAATNKLWDFMHVNADTVHNHQTLHADVPMSAGGGAPAAGGARGSGATASTNTGVGVAPGAGGAAGSGAVEDDLRAQLARAKSLNDDMWRHVVRVTMGP